jgi:hypothetical protein
MEPGQTIDPETETEGEAEDETDHKTEDSGDDSKDDSEDDSGDASEDEPEDDPEDDAKAKSEKHIHGYTFTCTIEFTEDEFGNQTVNRFIEDGFGKHPYKGSTGERRPCYRKEASTPISPTTVGIEKRSRIVGATLLFLQFVGIVTQCIIIFMTLMVLLNSLVDSFSANGYASWL